MVEYAYAYPKEYGASTVTGATVLNLKNITTDSTSSFASTYNFNGLGAIIVVDSWEDIELPNDAIVTNRYVEIATSLAKKNNENPTAYWENPQQTGKKSITNSMTVGSTTPPSQLSFNCNLYKTNGFNSEIRIYYVRLVVEYDIPNYNVSVTRVDHNNLKGQETSLNINISNLGQSAHTPKVNLSIPNGVSFTGSDKAVTVSGGLLTWTPSLSKSKLNDSVNISFSLNTLGVKTFTVNETYGTSPTRTVNITCMENIPEDTPSEIDGVPVSIILTGNAGLDEVKYPLYQIGYAPVNIYIKVDDSILANLDYITLTDSNSLCDEIPEHDDSDFTDNITMFSVTPLGDGSTDLQIEYSLTIDGVTTVYHAQHYLLNVLPDTLDYPFFSVLNLGDEEIDRLGNHTNYTVQTYMRINNPTEEFTINDWIKNYRIGVYNPEELPEDFDVTSLTPAQIFDAVDEWSEQPTIVNEYDSITCTFTHHKENPLYIVVTGDYSEGFPESIIEYSTPAIIESSVFNGYESTGNYPIPINGLISDTVSNYNVNKFENSTKIVLSEFGLEDGFGTNDKIGVTGIAFNLNCDYNDICTVVVTLRSPDGKTGQRSKILDNETVNITLGGPYDTWGFDITDLTDLNDFEVEVQVNNLFTNVNNIANLQVHNANITFYYNEIDSVLVDMFVDGSDIRYYGLFLEDAEIPEGLNTITKYIEIEGTDSHDSYRQNIDRKEIKVKLSLDSCNINDTTEMLRKVTQLFQNKRDTLNKPIPKRIEFSNYPDLYWEYILEDTFDSSFNLTNAEIDLTLVIPAGTAFAKEETVTSTTGGVTGIAKVNPVLTIIPLGDHVEILETNTQQKFSINYTAWSSNNLVSIDCSNRDVELANDEEDTEPLDISMAVDFNSDWFVLDGEYNFEATNCIIQSVTFTERW